MILLTLENCPPCEQVKKFIKEQNIEIPTHFYYRDMSKNSEELIEILSSLKVKKFPQLIVGEETYLGINIINKLKEWK